MRVLEARNLFRELTEEYFSGARVIFSNQSRAAKPPTSLVVITPSAVKRPYRPTLEIVDSEEVGYYQSRLSFTVDLFTRGSPVIDDSGNIVAYENSAVDDMLGYADFLNSTYVVNWSHMHDVAIIIEGDTEDTTGIINDHNYEYRARLTVMFYFTQETVGPTAVLKESSIQYPDGSGGYTPEEPVETESTTNDYGTDAQEREAGAIIVPDYQESSTGGGSGELAEKETGYFTSAEIKEDKQ